MGGSSGVLLAIFFAAAGDSSSSGSDIPNSLLDGLKRMKEIGGAELGDRSMVDALEPALNAFARAEDPAMASRKGAEETAKMISARVGRATYLSADQLQGNKDPGAEAVAKLFEYLVGRGGS
jgi:dihydroxyacetone kinase